MNSQNSVRLYTDYQIIYSVQTNNGKKAEEIAKVLGISKDKVYKTVERYNKSGTEWESHKQRGGRREKRCIMDLEDEEAFLKRVEGKALSGQIITYRQLKNELEKQLGRGVSEDYIWDLFKRHHWSKKVPRQTHPKVDKAAQEAYKKNSLNYWQPSR